MTILPAMVDKVKVTKRQAGMRWEREVYKARKKVGGSQDEIPFVGKGAGYKTNGRDAMKEKGK